MSANEDRPCHCMDNACICCYTACDFEDFVFGYKSSGDCLCLRSACCLAIGADSLGCGLTTDEDKGECCKLSCIIYEYALVDPQVLCSKAEQCLCFQNVASLPFQDDYLSECVCASCFIQCAPECGCCVKPPPCKALRLKKEKEEAPLAASAMTRE
jgi:hypothetical protein